jgi:hypothetical protein
MNGVVEKVAPTQTEALVAAPEAFTDKETVAMVQRMLLAKGYVDGGPADGTLNQKTKDEILTFRARNNLQLIPVIDRELIDALEHAPAKALPLEQVTATKEQIAPKVEVVKVADKVQASAWWTQIWAWVTGLPAWLIALAGFVIEHLDDATNAVAPLKNLLFDFQNINPVIWVVLIAIIATVMGYQAMTIARLSKKIEEAAVEGYQRGTIKNDLPPSEIIPDPS